MTEIVDGFSDLSNDKKSFELGKWYHDVAVKLYGAAFPVNYEPRSRRRKKKSDFDDLHSVLPA